MKFKKVKGQKEKMKKLFLTDINKINCYSTSLLFIMQKNNIDLTEVLKNLSSEYCFYYDRFNKVYTGVRLIENMLEKGFDLQEMSFCAHKKSPKFLMSLPNCSWFIVGMNCFNVPWHFLYKRQNTTHYFPVYKKDNDNFVAFDPMYGKENIEIKLSLIEDYAYEVKNIALVEKRINSKNKLKDTVAELKKIKDKLLRSLKKYPNTSEACKHKLIQYACAILNNKYLTKNYMILKNYDSQLIEYYNIQIIKNWLAIKFGIQRLFSKPTDLKLIQDLEDLVVNVTKSEIQFSSEISNLKI